MGNIYSALLGWMEKNNFVLSADLRRERAKVVFRYHGLAQLAEGSRGSCINEISPLYVV